jgi:hypothetical protein
MNGNGGPAHQRLDIVISFGTPLQLVEIEPPPDIFALIAVTYDRFTLTAKGHVMYTLPVDKMVKMQVSYVDAEGNPAAVDGDVEWTSSDESICTVTPETGDSTIVAVVPLGPVGQVQITATADADLGSGTRELITVADISIVAGEAVAGTISPVGTPMPKP